MGGGDQERTCWPGESFEGSWCVLPLCGGEVVKKGYFVRVLVVFRVWSRVLVSLVEVDLGLEGVGVKCWWEICALQGRRRGRGIEVGEREGRGRERTGLRDFRG